MDLVLPSQRFRPNPWVKHQDSASHTAEKREKKKNIKQKSKDRKISKRNDKGKPNINTQKKTHMQKKKRNKGNKMREIKQTKKQTHK